MDTPKQKIKKLMHAHEIDSKAQLAREFEKKNPGKTCSREQMSMCINEQREYPEIRRFLADRFKTTIEQLFGVIKKPRKAA
jgi:hypothetical protein